MILEQRYAITFFIMSQMHFSMSLIRVDIQPFVKISVAIGAP